MSVNPNAAIDAYRQAVSKMRTPGLEARDKAGGGFGELLKQATESSLTASREGEAMSAKAAAGNANMADVVTAVANAEVALQTVVAVRDRVVEAYQQIIRMPI